MAKGLNQVIREDYSESVKPVAKTATVRLFMEVGASRQWNVHQVDINNAYLHGFTEEDIYLVPPKGYRRHNMDKCAS